MPVYFVVPIVILSLILGGAIGEIVKPGKAISDFLNKDSIKAEKEKEEKAQKVKRGILEEQICRPISEMTSDESEETDYKLPAKVIKTSINSSKSNLDYSFLNLKPDELQTLRVDSLQEICSNPEQADLGKIEIWRKAIFLYQLKNNLSANGEIDDQTKDKVAKEVKEEAARLKTERLIAISFDILKNLIKKNDPDGVKKKEKLIEILNNALSQSKDKDNKSIQLQVSDINGSPNQKIKENWSKAIKAYQQQNRLAVDGLVGTKGVTTGKLKAELNLLSSSPTKTK